MTKKKTKKKTSITRASKLRAREARAESMPAWARELSEFIGHECKRLLEQLDSKFSSTSTRSDRNGHVEK